MTKNANIYNFFDLLANLPRPSLRFNFVYEETVLKLLENLPENKAAGRDNLSGKLFKDGATVKAKFVS